MHSKKYYIDIFRGYIAYIYNEKSSSIHNLCVFVINFSIDIMEWARLQFYTMIDGVI